MKVNLWDAMILGAGFVIGATIASLGIAFIGLIITVILSVLGVAILGS